MDEPAIIWRHGKPWRLTADGTYVLDAESQRIGYERLWRVAEAAYRLWLWLESEEPGATAIDAVQRALEAAGFDTATGTWWLERA